MQWKKCRFRFRDTLQTGRKTTPGRLLRTFSRNWFRRWIFFWIKTFDFLEIKIKIKDWLNQKEIVFRFQNIKKRQERSTTFFHSKLITSEFSDSHADGWYLWRPFSLNSPYLAFLILRKIGNRRSRKNFLTLTRPIGLPLQALQKSDGGSVRSDLKKLDFFTLEISKNHLIRTFLRNGRLRVKKIRLKLICEVLEIHT